MAGKHPNTWKRKKSVWGYKTSSTSSSGISLSLHGVGCQILQLLGAASSTQHRRDLEPSLFLQPGEREAARDGTAGAFMVHGAPRGAGLPPDPYSNHVGCQGQKIIARGNLTVAPIGKCFVYKVTEGPEMDAG